MHRFKELGDGSTDNGLVASISTSDSTIYLSTQYTDVIKVALWQRPGGQAPLTVTAKTFQIVSGSLVSTTLFEVDVVTDVATGYGEVALPAVAFQTVSRHG
jgi:hypothetical protein